MKYEVILFDADETLYDFKKSERESFKNTMLKFNINYDENYHLKIYSAKTNQRRKNKWQSADLYPFPPMR